MLKPPAFYNIKNSFIVETGESPYEICNRLQEEGLIRSALAAKIYLRVSKLGSKIQAGEFSFSDPLSIEDIFAKLQHGRDEKTITIPEGFRLEQVAARFCQANIACQEGYVRVLAVLRRELGEGYFFPDTYAVDNSTSLESLIETVKQNFSVKIKNVFDLPSPPLSEEKIMVLASLVEREAISDQERPVIAGILFNRIQEEWPLQVDATVQYLVGCQEIKKEECSAKDWWPADLTESDLKLNSNFNTYKQSGLPPQPICNPGLKSIFAAAQLQASDYYFYLHDKQGQVHYAKTLEEHNDNIAQFLR